MAQSNLELMREGFETYLREGVEVVLAVGNIDSEIEVYSEPGLVNAGTYYGHDGWRRFDAAWNEAWEEFGFEIEELIESDPSHVVAVVRYWARGAGSGIELGGERFAWLFEVRDGKLTRFHNYRTKENALTAARELAAAEPTRGGARG